MEVSKMRETFVENFKNGDWLYKCATCDTSSCPDQTKVTNRLWENAESVDDFMNAVRDCEELKYTSVFYSEAAELFKWEPAIYLPDEPEKSRYMIVMSDKGDVVFGDVAGTVSFGVACGSGDGAHEVFVIERDGAKFNENCFKFITSIEGRFKIYDYDCAPLEPATDEDVVLEGRYFIYVRDNTMIVSRASW